MPDEFDSKNVADLLQRAREEGKFQGEVLTQLKNVADTLKGMTDKHDLQDKQINSKVSQEDFNKLAADVKSLQKIAYIGMGILVVIQVAVPIVISFVT